jgi:hypothetical protein
MNRPRLSSALLATLAALAMPLSAQQVGLAAAVPDLAVDAEAYARQFDVSPQEALRRLALQAEIGALDAWLAEKASDTFAGLSIEHRPEHKVIARFTDLELGPRLLAQRAGARVAFRVEVQPARRSLVELQALLERTAEELRTVQVEADLQINVRTNLVEVLTVDAQLATAALAVGDKAGESGLAVLAVSQLTRPDMLVQGGRPITDFGAASGCTSAFVVRSSGGELGVTTAGHCANNQTHTDDFTTLTFRAEDFEGNQDLQWHSAGCGVEFRNEFDSGTGMRNVTGSLGRGGQSVGAFVCKHGRSTGATCGTIGSKSFCPSYVPNGKSTFVCVNPGNIPLSQPGDSGGPWFSGNTAYGVHSGGNGAGTLAIYMPIDYISSLGLTVLNYNAGMNPPTATVTCPGNWAGNQYGRCWASGSGGVPPYTYESWRYYDGSYSATSWGSAGDLAYVYFENGCPLDSYHSFSVTIRDSCGAVGFGGGSFECPDSGVVLEQP